MKNERLFGIIYILLSKGTVTAKELAEYFEVSTRTIYRDIDTLSSLHIPIYMSKGKNGGISLLDNYKLDKMLLTDDEQKDILFSIDGMNKITNNQLFYKIKTFFDKRDLKLVDFKLEFGRDNKGEIILADEISPDSCRLWDKATNQKLDKDRFRQDLGNVKVAYEEVLRRMLETK